MPVCALASRRDNIRALVFVTSLLQTNKAGSGARMCRVGLNRIIISSMTSEHFAGALVRIASEVAPNQCAAYALGHVADVNGHAATDEW